MAISIDQIKELREETGSGVLDCRQALEKANGDYKKAVEILRDKGLAKAAKRVDREASEGVVDLYSHGDGRLGVMVEVNCETDFVARSKEFRAFAHNIALQVAGAGPRWIDEDGVPEQVLENEREKARKQAIEEGKPEQEVDRIVKGRLNKFLDEMCLMRQPYIRDDTITVKELLLQNIASIGENIVVRRFARWELGESNEG
ncbi:MAG: translation elongation factor Ts [Chloroflexota bacterium]